MHNFTLLERQQCLIVCLLTSLSQPNEGTKINSCEWQCGQGVGRGCLGSSPPPTHSTQPLYTGPEEDNQTFKVHLFLRLLTLGKAPLLNVYFAISLFFHNHSDFFQFTYLGSFQFLTSICIIHLEVV